jgi:hypothetical protein
MQGPVRYITILVAMLAGCSTSPTSTHKRKVHISKEGEKYVLYRDGRPFMIKGAAGFADLRKLHNAGGNTIRTWDTLNLGRVLDEAHANNIAVIAGFPMPVSSYLVYYKNPSLVAAQYAAFKNVVNRYKSHPALLMWCLGNEVDFPNRPRFNPFYKAYNRLLKMIHTEDPDHPVTTALINFNKRCIYNIRVKVPALDLISMNIFGELSTLEEDLDKFSWCWNGPFLVSEWGINGPWESEFTAWGAPIENTSTKKAEQYLQLYQQSMPVKNPRYLGSCVFYWGRKQEVTHTWFSLFTEKGEASETVNVLEYLWTGKWPAQKAPALKYMLLADRGARDNIMFRPGTEQSATVLFQSIPDDSLHVHWEILEEDWYTKNRYETNTQKPAAFDSLLLTSGKQMVKFRAPAQEGPYRIFATVYDNNGHFASTNTPFYVVGQ